MILRWLIGLIGLALVLWLLPEAERAEPVEDYHVAMGTVVRLALYVDEQEAPRLFAVAPSRGPRTGRRGCWGAPATRSIASPRR
jgi:hypothetical protein